MLLSLSTLQIHAQQNPYPFNLDLNFGGGLIGDPDVNTSFQPEIGFSYMPGRFGMGLNAGLLSYDPAFDAQQYTTGFEEYTSVSGSDEKWSSFFFSVGPRFEFSSRLPVTFRSSLDLSLSYNSPPSVSIDFNDPDGSAGDLQLQLSGHEAGDDYSKWSAAIRPEFQMQFSPGGSDRFAINLTTGFQHRFSKNEFTYTQRDLSEVRVVPNAQEMYMQFEMAPEVQRSAQPPKTNLFTTVGLKIKFGFSKADSKKALDGFTNSTSRTTESDNNASCENSDSRLCGKTDHLISSDIDDDKFREAHRLAKLANPTGTIITLGGITAKGKKALGLEMQYGENPLYQSEESSGENPLYEGEANDGDSDNNDPAPVQRYDMQPSSHCVSLSVVPDQVLKTFFETGDKPAAPQYDGDSQIAEDESLYRWGNNELRVCHSEENLTQEEFADLIDSYIHRVEDGIYLHVDGSKENVYCWGNNELRECPGEKTKTQSQFGNLIDSMVHRLDDGGDSGGTITVDLPEMMKSASFSISKRSARTGRSQNPIHEEGGNMQANPMYESEEMASGNGGGMDGDAEGFHFELEINDMRSRVLDAISKMDSESPDSRADSSNSNAKPGMQMAPSQTKVIIMGVTDDGDIIPLEESQLSEFNFNGDPDSDDDGLMDAIESATYSISKRSARTGKQQMDDPCGPGVWTRTTGGSENCSPENTDQETPEEEVSAPSEVYQWTYKISSPTGGEGLPKEGTVTVLFTGGAWHFDVQIDPDLDEDGYGDLLKNSSFSISKRSARTGRN